MMHYDQYRPPLETSGSSGLPLKTISLVFLAVIWICYHHSVFGFENRTKLALAMITVLTVVGNYLWIRVLISIGSLLIAISSARYLVYYSAYDGPHLDTYLVAGIAFLLLLGAVQLLQPRHL